MSCIVIVVWLLFWCCFICFRVFLLVWLWMFCLFFCVRMVCYCRCWFFCFWWGCFGWLSFFGYFGLIIIGCVVLVGGVVGFC